MNPEERWIKVDELGEGGQGKVYRAYDRNRFGDRGTRLAPIHHGISTFSPPEIRTNVDQIFDGFMEAINKGIDLRNPVNQVALKILHEPREARDPEKGRERINREIEAMQRTTHPNLLSIIDLDPDRHWFVSNLYTRGTLHSHLDRCVGNVEGALSQLRPVVTGVACLHKQGIVHRDIKPNNIYVREDGGLVLGDFGLVYLVDGERTRLTNALENVGTHNWMPGWAQGMKLDDVKPSFDVYSLGKVFWAMISGKLFMRHWYYEKEEFNLQRQFPEDPAMIFANRLIAKCVVEEQKDCLPDAEALLNEIDRTVTMLKHQVDPFDSNLERLCRVCGLGKYTLQIDGPGNDLRNFGINAAGSPFFKMFSCTKCGHIQMFYFHREEEGKSWPPRQ
jgi:serine/threonine protein kinase